MNLNLEDNHTELQHYGWNAGVEARWNKEFGLLSEYSPARVTVDLGQKYRLITSHGELLGEMTGRMRHDLDRGIGTAPAVGDWVAVISRPEDGAASIHGVLGRTGQISRQAAGQQTKEQIVASNVDVLFLVVALNHDFNLRRLERYLIMAYSSGASPVILLSKSDLCEDVEYYKEQVESIAPGVPVCAVSALEDQGLDQLTPFLREGMTCALTGSSGCGKSTLLNRLAGEDYQVTQGIREDDSRGRHTTTHRELFPLPGGGVLIDTPGMRELQLWDGGGEGLGGAFSDIEGLAEHCRFRDCTHTKEQGCAVLEAVRNQEMQASRLTNFHKTARELKYQAKKESQRSSMKDKSAPKTKRNKAVDWRGEVD